MGILRKIAFEVGKAFIGADGDMDDIYSDSENTDDSGFLDFADDDMDNDVLDMADVPDESNISFGHAHNDGTYTNSGKDIALQVAGGNSKGSYDVFYHHGQKYIDFQNQWIKIEGKDRFSLNGNTYIIK